MVPHNTLKTKPSPITVLVACVLGCGLMQGAAAEFDPGVIKMESMPVVTTRTAQRANGDVLRHFPSKIAAATLDELGRKQALQQSTLSPSPAGQSAEPEAPKPLQIGLGRPVTLFATSAATVAALTWETGPEGRQFAALSVAAAGAVGLRMGLMVDALPDSALIHFLTANHITVETYTGAEVRETLKQNLASGDTSEQGRTFWSPVIDGEVAFVVIELPADVSATEVNLSVPVVSHLFRAPAELSTKVQAADAGALSPCHVDATCSPDWLAESASVAKMVFTENGQTYGCTGTLLASPRQKPYLVSAQHCVSSQTVASTLQTYWWYQTASCNGASTDPLFQSRTGGAKLLYSSPTDGLSWTDTSFMLLNTTPPATALLAAWSVSPLSASASVGGLHHPLGTWKKVSFGTVGGYQWCVPGEASTYGCFAQNTLPGATHYGVLWDSGTTQGGSSGSGLWGVTVSGKRYFVGQLSGGEHISCTKVENRSDYGRFDLSFHSALRRWLWYRPVAQDDLGGDGRSDLIWRDLNSGKNWAWQMDSAAQPAATLINTFAGSGWTMAGFGDYNGDGKADILWHDTASGSASVYYMNGTAINSRTKLPAIASGWKIVGSGDFNADGLDDLVFHNRETGALGAWIMNGTASPQWRSLTRIPDANWSVAGMGDFDGDGTADILWFNAASGASGVHVFKNGAYSRTIDLPIAAKGWVPVGVGDLNRDYVADIVWREAKTGSIGAWFMNGTNNPAWSGITQMPDLNWEIKRLGDFDGDGKTDLFWLNRVNNASAVYLMDAHIIKGIVNTGFVTAP